MLEYSSVIFVQYTQSCVRGVSYWMRTRSRVCEVCCRDSFLGIESDDPYTIMLEYNSVIFVQYTLLGEISANTARIQ